MSVEQVARDFVTTMSDAAKTKAYLTSDAMATGGSLPQPVPALEAFNIISGMLVAFPDLKFDVQEVTVNGNQATVRCQLSGTHTGVLKLPLPGMPGELPPTGKKVSVPDTLTVTVQGDKVSQINLDTPAGTGIPSMIAQLAAKA